MSEAAALDALLRKAVAAFQAGDHARAAALFGDAIALSPAHAAAHNNLGVALMALGRTAEAREKFARAVQIKPDYAEAHYNLGNAERDLGAPNAAWAYYDTALSVDPQFAEAWNARGNLLRDLGRLEGALDDFDRAIALQPDRAALHNNRGTVLKQAGQLDAARESFARAAVLDPALAEAHYNLGNVLKDMKDHGGALVCYDTALALKPDHAAALNNRGNVLRSLKRQTEAIASYSRAIAAAPDHVDAYINRAAAAADLGRAAEALSDFDRAVALAPENPDAHNGRGIALRELGRHGEAEAAHRAAIARAPDHAEAHWALAVCLLQQGDFARGWPLYEWRWKAASLRLDPRNFAAPLWLGDADLAGKTILVHGEQGLGDTLQFARYAPLVAARGGRVVLEVAAPLVSLLGRLSGAAQVLAKGETLPAFDLHCPLLSLPLALKTTLGSIPPSGYVQADAAKRAIWAARLGPRTRRRIGLSWSGNASHRADLQRSIALADFVAMLPPGEDYVSLQKDERAEDQAALAARPDIRRFANDLHDFDDTAALCTEMDLIISVDTSIAHLAGAMNKPVWILLASNSDWRWLLRRTDSPWYASAKLYRQDTAGDWAGVFARVKGDLNPDAALAHLNRGIALAAERRFDEALQAYAHVLAIEPDHFAAHANSGAALRARGDLPAALTSFDRALALRPDHAEAHLARARVHRELKNSDAALEDSRRAAAFKPDLAAAHAMQGALLIDRHAYAAALAALDTALGLQPDLEEALINRGLALAGLGRDGEALKSFDAAVRCAPESAAAHYHKGMYLFARDAYEQALVCFDRALALAPDYDTLFGLRVFARMRLCDWNGIEGDVAELSRRILAGEKAAPPLLANAVIDSPAVLRRAAEIWTAAVAPPNPALGVIPRQVKQGRRKIRVGYFSMDFREHPVAQLTAGLFEAHNRDQFEVYGYSYGPDTGDAMRRRLEKAFDHFVDVRAQDDRGAAALARSADIDIAVDLAGHTTDARTGIFALRAAPVQACYLGYAGTMGAAYIDYVIADGTVAPPDQYPHYAEKIVRLPWFQANDRARPVPGPPLGRAELGLPQRGFVFASFNNSYKITPDVFTRWMRILQRTPGSVLMLVADSAAAPENLRREAAARGVDPSRLVFCGRMPTRELYLARFGVADLFLDTLPYNAQATGSDALWAGLPLLTCYAARTGASLLAAVGLPELVAETLDAYEDLAVALANTPARVTAFKQRLARRDAPLFDIGRFARHMENAYTQMYARHMAGLAPDHIDVAG